MSSLVIDKGVVQIGLDKKDFEKGVESVLKSLDKLEEALNLADGSKGLEHLAKTADSVDFTKLQNNVEQLNKKLSVTGVIGATVVSKITEGAMNLAKSGIGKLTSTITNTFNQIEEGGKKRAKNIANAKFQLEGLGVAWNDIKDDINYGVQDTAYGLDAAAKAAAQLSASQVKVGTDMRNSLRAISGVASMTNSSYEEISNIFTTVAGNGRLMGDQLTQLSYKGLNTAASLAKAFTESEEMAAWFYESYTAHAKKNDEAIQKGAEITESAVRTLVTNGGLDYQHFADAMDQAFGAHAKEANNTFAGTLDNVNAALSKIGAEFAGPFYDNMINPLNRIREIFNNVRGYIQPAIDAFNELEYVILAKVEKILFNLEKILPEGVKPFAENIATFIRSFTESIGGEELETLEKVRKEMQKTNKDVTTSEVIEKANASTRAYRNLQKATESVSNATEDENTGWNKLTSSIEEAGLSVEEYEKAVKETASKQGKDINGLLDSYGDLGDLFASGELDPEIATEALDAYVESIGGVILKTEEAGEVIEGTSEKIKAASGGYSKSAQEMHDAIQGIWSEKHGQSWETRERLLTEQGFSEAEIEEIHAVVNEMQKSGRTLSSDIDEVYGEIDSTIDKTTDSSSANINKLTRDEEREFGKQKTVVEEVQSKFEIAKNGIIGFVSGIGAAFQNVFMSKEKKPFEEMTTVEKFFSGIFNVIKVGGQVAWAILTGIWNTVNGLIDKIKQTKLYEWVKGRFDSFLEMLNNLSFEKIKGKIDDFINGVKNIKLFGDLKAKFEELKKSISENGLVETIKAEWEKLKTFLSEHNPFKNTEGSLLGWNALTESLQKILSNDDVIKTFENIKNAIKDFFTSLFGGGDESATGSEETEAEAENISKLSTAIKDLGGAVEKPIGMLEKFRATLDKIKEVAGPVWEKLEPFISGLSTPDGVMGLLHGLEAVGIIKVLSSLKKMFKTFSKVGEGAGENAKSITDSISKAIGNFGGIGESISGTISNIGDSISAMNKAAGRESNSKAIRNVAIAIGILAASLIALSFVPQDRLKTAGIALAAIAAGIVVLSLAVSKFMAAKAALAEAQNKEGGYDSKGLLAPLHDGFEQIGKGISKMGTAAIIISIAVAVLAFVAALALMKKVIEAYAAMPESTWKDGGSKVAAVFAALALGIAVIGAACKGSGAAMLGVAPTIIAFLAALTIMLPLLKAYSMLPMAVYQDGLIKVAGVLAVLTGAIVIIGLAIKQVNPLTMLATAVAIITLTAAVVVLTGALVVLSLIPAKRLQTAAITLAGILTVLVLGISLIAKALEQVSAATMIATAGVLVALSLAIIVLTAAIIALSLVPQDLLQKGVAAVAIILGELCLGIAAIGKALKEVNPVTMIATAGVIVALSLAIVVLVAAIYALALIPISRLNSSTTALTIMMHMFASMEKSAKGLDKGAAASVLAMAVTIGVIAYALYQLSSIEGSDLAGPTAAIAALIGMMSKFAKASKMAPGESISVGSILSMVVILGAVAGVLYLLAKFGDVDRFIPIAQSISLLMLALSASIKIIGNLPPSAGLQAGAVIAGFVAVLVALGLVAGLAEKFSGGAFGDTLAKCGEVIGKFIGGIAKGVTDKLDEVSPENIEKLGSLLQAFASINIPDQASFQANAEGITIADKSLNTFAKGMKGVVEAVNMLQVPEDSSDFDAKIAYFGAVADFTKQLAAIEIPVQEEYKWDETGISYTDTSLDSFATGMEGVVRSVNAIVWDPFTMMTLPLKLSYMQGIADFVSKVAEIKIPTQWSIDLSLIEGFSVKDNSLKTLAEGLQGAVTAVNSIVWNPFTAATLTLKLSYMQGIASFITDVAAIKVPTQWSADLSLVGGFSMQDNSLATLAQGLQGAVTAVNSIAWNPFTVASLTLKLSYMQGIADFITDVAKIDVPIQTETKATWRSYRNVDKSLGTFAEGLQGVVTAVNDIKFDLGVTLTLPAKLLYMQSIAGFVRDLAAIDIPVQKEEIETKFGIFGSTTEVKDSSLVSFATGMKEVSNALNGMTTPNVTLDDVQLMSDCVAAMAIAAGKIPEWNSGISEFFTTNSLSAFASEMKTAAPDIQEASEKATGINLNNISTVSSAITAMSGALDLLTGSGTDYSYEAQIVSNYAGLLRDIGPAFAGFDGLQNVKVEDIERIPSIIEALKGVSETLSGGTEEKGGILAGAAKAIGNVVGGGKDNPFQALIDNVKDLGAVATNVTNITSLATALKTLSSDSVANFTSGFNDTEGTVKEAVDALIQNAVTAITDTSTDTQAAFQEAGAAFLASLAEGMKDTSGITVTGADSSGAQALVEQMAASINSESNKETFKSAGSGFLASLADGMSDTTTLTTPAVNIVNSICNALKFNAEPLFKTGNSLVSKLASGFKGNISAIVSAAQDAGKRAKAGVASYENAFYNVGVNMALGIKNGINAYVGSIVSAAASAVRQAVNAAKQEGDIASPSRKMIEVGKFLDLGLSKGLERYSKISSASAAGVAHNIIDTIDSVLDIHSPSKVMYKKGKQTVQGYAYGVDKNGKILVKSTKKAAQKALKAQKKSDKQGQAQRIANQKAELEKQRKNTKKSNKKQQRLLKSQINALNKLQKDYGKVAAKGTAGLTKAQKKKYEDAAKKESARLDKIVTDTTSKMESKERDLRRSLTAKEEQTYWKSTLNSLTKGSKQYNDTVKQIQDLDREIENETLEGFEKTLSHEQERRDWSLGEEIKYWKSKVSAFKTGSEAWTKLQDKLTTLNNNFYKSLNNAQKTTENNMKNSYTNLLDKIKDIWKQYEDDIKSRGESLRDTSGLFDFFESGSYETADTLIENLRSQVDGLEKFQTNMDSLRAKVAGAGLDDAEVFLDQLENLGPSANANLENLLNMTDSQWTEYVNLYNKRSKEANAEAAKDVNISSYNKQAQEAIDEANKDIKDFIADYAKTIKELGISITEPSITVGANTVNGMIKGINENETTLLATVSSLATSIMDAAKKELGIHSPSRKFALFGMYMDLGMIQGLEAYKDKVTETSASVGQDSLQAMQDAIDYAAFIGASDYDFNPVITPVLDDSQILAGMGYISQLMAQQQLLQMMPNYQTQGLTSPSASQIQNDLISGAMNRLASLVSSNGGTVELNNVFNITSNNPREVADEVSRILNKQVQQKERTWA